MNNKEKRIAYAPKRLLNLKRLRSMGAPAWIIKSEQIAMVLNRKGYKHTGIASTPSQMQACLYEKHVQPLLLIAGRDPDE